MERNNRQYEDHALREALCRISKQLSQVQMSDDFEQRVMNSMRRNKTRLKVKVAAMLVGVLMVSGMTLAAWQLSNRNGQKTPSEDVQTEKTLQPVEVEGSIVRFDNVLLDSVLTIVAQHYQKQVSYRHEAIRYLHLHIEWNQAAPLSDFLTLINNFEGISLREEQDTIIAE